MSKEFTIKDTNDKEVKLMVRNASYEDSEQADRSYSAKLASLLREKGSKKLLMRQELDKIFKDGDIWGKTEEDKVKSLQSDIDKLLNKIRKGGLKVTEGRQICIDIADKRKEIVQIMHKRQMFDAATVESVAEAEKLDFLIYTCTVYAEDSKNYWESFDDMKNDKTSNIYTYASNLVYEVVFGVDPAFEKNLPENKWLKKYNFVDDELYFIDRKTGKKVDKTGKPIEELEESTTKQLDNLQGDIVEEQPFIDDETLEPILA